MTNLDEPDFVYSIAVVRNPGVREGWISTGHFGGIIGRLHVSGKGTCIRPSNIWNASKNYMADHVLKRLAETGKVVAFLESDATVGWEMFTLINRDRRPKLRPPSTRQEATDLRCRRPRNAMQC